MQTLDAMGGANAVPSMGAATDVPALRAQVGEMVAQMAASQPPPDYSGVKKSEIQIPMRDGKSIRTVLYQPESGAPGPLVVLYHGGGFCIGFPEMEEGIALEVVRTSGATALSVDYRMAPEHPFPGPTDDSWDALKWAAANASKIGADPSKGFIIGGTSAGGIITCVLSHQARDEKLSPPLTGIWLNIPSVVAQSQIPPQYRDIMTAFKQNENAPILDRTAIDFFMKWYAPVESDPKHSALLWPGGHKDLPPHLIQCAGLDPLRDDALVYTGVLKEAGVPVETIVYPGVPHGFDGMFAQLGATKKFIADRGAWFAKALGKK